MQVYEHLAQYRTFTFKDVAYVAAERKAQNKVVEDMKAQQKLAAKDKNFDLARYYSDEAKAAMKRYRAACLVLGYCSGNAPGDSPYIPMRSWSVDLAEELDSLLYYLELHHPWEIEDALQELDYAIVGMLNRFNSNVDRMLKEAYK